MATNERPLHRALLLLGPLAALLVFAPSVQFSFVWDDVPLIVENPHLRGPRAFTHAVLDDYWGSLPEGSSRRGYFWRPLVTLSRVLAVRLFGLEAWPLHAFNVALHAGTCALVFVWVRRRLRDQGALAADAGATVASLVFALHPTRFESVTWVSGTPDLLMAAFALTALCLAQRPRAAAGVGPLLALALLSKESAALVPVALAADLAWAGEVRQRKGALASALLGLLAAVVLRWWVQPPAPTAPLTGDSLAVTAGRVLAALGLNIQRTLAPWTPTLVPFDFVPLGGARFEVPLWAMAEGAAWALALGVLLWAAWRRPAWRGAAADVTLFLVLVAPFLQVLPLPSHAFVTDRYLYLPVLGFAALFGRAVATAVARGGSVGAAALLAAALWTFAFGARLAWAVPAWETEPRLWNREYALHPDNAFVGEAWARSLGGLGFIRASELVFARTLERPAEPWRRVVTAVAYAGTASVTTRDEQTERLEELAAFYDSLYVRRRPLTMLALDGHRFQLSAPRGPGAELDASQEAGEVMGVRAEMHARLGHFDLAQTLLEQSVRWPNAPAQRWVMLARLLAWRGDFGGAQRTLAETQRRFPQLDLRALAQLFREGERLKASPPLDPGERALKEAALFSHLGSARLARQVLAAAPQGQPGDRQLLHARVQVEISDHAFESARALLNEALRTTPAQPELLSAVAEVARLADDAAAQEEAQKGLAEPGATMPEPQLAAP